MCSPKSHAVRHSQTCPVFLARRQLARVLVAQVSGWRLALGRSCWQGQLIKRCPACCDKPSIYSCGFWMFIKCPMFANEQWNKAPWDLLGSPIVMLIIPLTFLDDGSTASLIVIISPNWQAHETPQSCSRCQAWYFMPWAEQRCKQHLGLKIIQPLESIWSG